MSRYGDCERAFGLALATNMIKNKVIVICLSIFYNILWGRNETLIFEMQEELFKIGNSYQPNIFCN